MTADWLLVGGDVRTMDGRRTRATAVALCGSSITAVGTDAEVGAARGPTTRVLELDGRTVLPGINDSHAHVGWWALATAAGSLDVRPARAPSVSAVQDLVAGAAARVRRGTWILGYGWDQTRFEDRRLPTRAELDLVAPHHPVALTHFSGHAMWVNGEALRRAGIDRATTVPAGSAVVRDAGGDPSGVLLEPGATGLVARLVPAPEVAELAGILEQAIAALHRLGITSFTEPALAPGDPDRAFTFAFAEAYAHLARAGRLTARVSVLEFFHRHGVTAGDDVRRGVREEPRLAGADPRRLRIGGVKLFADGVFSARTSWLREPYVGGGRGSLVVDGADEQARLKQLRSAIGVAHDAGRQVQVHATGDAAVAATVEAMVDAQRRTPRDGPGHVLIHGVLTDAGTLDRMARHGIGLNAQPTVARIVGGNLFAVLGPERARHQSPLRWAVDAGVPLALSTDIPIAPDPDWRTTVADAVLRETETGPAIAGQRLTVDEALHGVTVAGARQDGADGWKGTIEPGKVADLCVLDGPLRDDDVTALQTTGVAATFFDGELVHATPPLAPSS